MLHRFRVAVVAFAALAIGTACNSSTTSIVALTMRLVTPTTDAQTLVAPSTPQHVAVGTSQTFAVNAMAGYHVSSLVGGTCPAGTWSQNIYKTGAVEGDCTIIFSSTIAGYDVTATGTHATMSPTGDITVPSGNAQSFTVTADAGYQLTQAVDGTCAAGTWRGNVYTTGAIDSNCDLHFAAMPVHFLVSPINGNVSTAPVGPQPVLWGGNQSFTVTANSGFALSQNIAGTCAAGSWNGSVYTTGAVDANCTVVFDAAAVTSPNVSSPALYVDSVSTAGGNATFRFGWIQPDDTSTSASNMNYFLCASYPDPAHGSFQTPQAVLGGNICVQTTGVANANISVPLGHAYLFNVVASNVYNANAVYQARGEIADAAQLFYLPFEANIKDRVGNVQMNAASYQGVNGNLGAWANDRFNVANNARAFDATTTDCLATQTNLSASLTGSNSRTMTFWLKSGVNASTAIAASIGGDGNPMVHGDHFGLVSATPSGSGTFHYWWFGEDVSTTATYVDNSVWNFWALTYDGTGTLASAYLNGQLVGQNATWSTTPVTASTPLWVGCGVDGSAGSIGTLGNYWTGAIDDIRLFSRVLGDGTNTNGSATPTNEIGHLYDATRP